MQIKLQYQPLRLQAGNVSENDFDLYISQPRWASVAKKMAIEPLENAMKNSNKEEFTAGNLIVKRKIGKRNVTSWKNVYDSVVSFLSLRAQDSRDFDMDGLKQFEGLGYCILSSDLNKFIGRQAQENTSRSTFPQLFWPRKKKADTYPTKIELPDKDYSKITPDNMRIVQKAKGFCSGLDKEVTEAFKTANKKWFEQETGYDMKNLPKDDSPVKRVRMLAGGKPVIVQLVREQVPEYKEVIGMLQAEIFDLEEHGGILEGYKTKQTTDGTYINMKNLSERLGFDNLNARKLVKTEGRYEIVP